MVINGNEVYRNLEEQVLKNKTDIADLTSTTGLLGIKVIGDVADVEELPAENSPEFEALEYGDTYAVGDGSDSYDYYVKTRANEDTEYDHWFNIGHIQGQKGDPGLVTSITMDGTTYEHVDGNITLPAPPVKSVNGKINYVTLRAADLKYDSSAGAPTVKDKIDAIEADLDSKADLSDLDDKIDKYYIPNTAYAVDTNGNQTMWPIAGYAPNAIARFNNGGRLSSASLTQAAVENPIGNERIVVTKQTLNEKTGFLDDLTTTDKSNLVAAINEVAAGGGGGAVDSVNGQTGTVVLAADDINADNSQSIQTNLERIDSRIDTFVEDNLEGSDYISVDEGLSGKYVVELDQTKLDTEVTEDSDNLITSGAVYDGLSSKLDNSRVAFVNSGLICRPIVTPIVQSIATVDTNNDTEFVRVGDGLTIEEGYLKATGGGGGGTEWVRLHHISPDQMIKTMKTDIQAQSKHVALVFRNIRGATASASLYGRVNVTSASGSGGKQFSYMNGMFPVAGDYPIDCYILLNINDGGYNTGYVHLSQESETPQKTYDYKIYKDFGAATLTDIHNIYFDFIKDVYFDSYEIWGDTPWS